MDLKTTVCQSSTEVCQDNEAPQEFRKRAGSQTSSTSGLSGKHGPTQGRSLQRKHLHLAQYSTMGNSMEIHQDLRILA